jgi:Flp pilus assembly protein TadG
VSRLLAQRRSTRRRSRGQGLVEFAIIVPLFLLILLAMAEFGFVFSHHLTLTYATREGARTGSALADGGSICAVHGATTNIDEQVIASVQRVLTSPGSQVDRTRVAQIRIYKADASGAEAGYVNVWVRGAWTSADGTLSLEWQPLSGNWSACGRDNGVNADSLGVSITYTYNFVTPLSSVLRFFGGPSASSLAMSDKTVMQLNPTQ